MAHCRCWARWNLSRWIGRCAQLFSRSCWLGSLSVDGFERTEFFPTTLGGAAFIAPQLGIYAAGSGVKGEYRTVSDASMTRWFLEDTRCVRRVREATGGALRIEGQAGSENHVGFIGALTWVVIVFSLTAVVGVPYTSYADGWAVARLEPWPCVT